MFCQTWRVGILDRLRASLWRRFQPGAFDIKLADQLDKWGGKLESGKPRKGRLGTPVVAGIMSIATLVGAGATPAFATDGIITGTVLKLDMTEASNLAFRIYLTGSPAMCGNTNTWAYVEVSDTNYQGYVSFVMSAWLANKTLKIYSNRDASGYCQINYITAQ